MTIVLSSRYPLLLEAACFQQNLDNIRQYRGGFRSVITFFSPTSYKSAPFFRQENGKFFILHCHGIHYQIVSFTIIIRVGCVRSVPALTRATATSPWLFLTVSTTADRFFTVQHGHFRSLFHFCSLFQQEVDNLRGVRLVPPPRDPIIT